MTAIPYSQVRKGMVLVGADGQLHLVVDRALNGADNWRSILQLRLKHLKTGHVQERRVHPDEQAEQAALDKREMQYIYQDGDGYVFMDTESFDQVTLAPDAAGELPLYLKEGMRAHVIFHEGAPLSLEPPTAVELAVTDTEPPVQGGAAVAPHKPALLETGLKVLVPPFINVGETIVVDTRNGAYLGRARAQG